MEAAQVSLLRWLRRQLRQPIPAREHLEAAVENDDVAEARRLLAGFEFSDDAAPERRATARRLGAPEAPSRTLAPPVPLGAGVLVLLDVELRVGDRAQDLARARQLGAIDVPLGVPEVGAQQRLRALRVRLLDLDEDPEPRHLPLHLARGEQLRVVDDPRAAVDAKRVVDARDQEQQRDPVVLEQVRERVGELVSRPVGQEQRPLVEDPDEAGRIAARRHVEPAVGPAGRDDDERRALDELPRERVEPVDDLRLRTSSAGSPPSTSRSCALVDDPSITRTSAAASRARRRRPRARPGRSCRGTRARARRRRSARRVFIHSLSESSCARCAEREPDASRRAISSARSSSSSSGTQSETSPMRSASTPSTSSHSSRRYFAFAIPHRSGQTIAAWSPAATPSFVWPSTMRAFGRASETSARRPTTSPAPTAGPVIAETIGVGQREHVVDEVARLVEDALPRLLVVGDAKHEVEVAARAEHAVGAANENRPRLLVLRRSPARRARARRAAPRSRR